MSDEKVEKNPARYRDMSVPHESYEKATEAVTAFYDDVMAARIKHRVADASIVVDFNYVGADGSEATAMHSSHFGNSLVAASLLAFAYGVERGRQDELLDAAASGRRKKKAAAP